MVASIALIASGLVLSTRALAAPSTTWSPVKAPTPTTLGGSLSDVSCASPHFCLAAGSLVEFETRHGWTQTYPHLHGAGVVGVSCTSPGFCVIVASSATAVEHSESWIWNGHRWRIVPMQGSAKITDQVASVSCASRSFCVSTAERFGPQHSGGVAQEWNGHKWASTVLGNGDDGFDQIGPASCAAPGVCTVLGKGTVNGHYGQVAATLRNGRWHLAEISRDAGATRTDLSGISCVTPDRCVAVGSRQVGGTTYDIAVRRANGFWAAQQILGPIVSSGVRLSGVSCQSWSRCIAVGYRYHPGHDPIMLASRGATWRRQRSHPDHHAVLHDVSCARTCIAVGNREERSGARTLVERGPRHWTTMRSVDAHRVDDSQSQAMSCATPTFCELVGSYRRKVRGAWRPFVEVKNGSNWKVRANSFPVGYVRSRSAWVDVSCGAANLCMAIGRGFVTDTRFVQLFQRWDGTTRSSAPLPTPAGASQPVYASVSCTTSTFCVAVGQAMVGESLEPIRAVWNGATWTAAVSELPSGTTAGSLASVSCTTPSACVAVGAANARTPNGGYANRWNGSAWTAELLPAPTGGQSTGPLKVACAGTGLCLLLGEEVPTGSGTDAPYLQQRLGGTWSNIDLPGGDSPAFPASAGLACMARRCVAVGVASDLQSAFASVWDGSAWSDQTVTGGTGRLGPVTCLRSGYCLAATSPFPQPLQINPVGLVSNQP